MYKVGLIGAGNMGGAILRGMIRSGYVPADHISVYDTYTEKLAEYAADFPGIHTTASAAELTELSDIVILAVKPNVLASVAASIAPALNAHKSVISIAAGWSVSMLKEAFQQTGAAYLRVMPNTPALIGEGMTALCLEHTMSEEIFAFAKGIFDAVGRTVILPERLFDGVIAISGSSPAYVYMFIEALADGGVREGLPRAVAYEMAAQSVLGSAKMVLETKKHPGELKDAVCSPGGTTIDAVAALERSGLRAAVLDAVEACADKSRAMTK